MRLLQERRPASLEICTLLDKPSRRLIEVPVKYVGFTIPDQFVVGYGLDYDQKFRNLPFVGVLKPEVYSA
ncbi:Hypoxanthine-guanine phosphoribosyltransferase [compost metagenome]